MYFYGYPRIYAGSICKVLVFDKYHLTVLNIS